MNSNFAELGLAPAVVAALRKRGIEQPTPIQSRVYEPASEGRDVLARSRTGSGKTLAFGLPLFTRLDAKIAAPQLLILTPTRELAVQVSGELKDVAAVHGLSTTEVIGGASMRHQIYALKKAHIVTGTPGRIIDHLDRGTLSLKHARAIVLDEGDEMLDMGFLDDMLRILETFPKEGQRLLFSATVPPAMKKVIHDYLRKPVTIETESSTTTHADISHVYYRVKPTERYAALANLLLHDRMERVLVFTQTREESREVAQRLVEDGFAAAYLNGDLSQDQRTHVMEGFKSGRVNLLVATDVAARGIDVQGLSHVVHYTIAGSTDAYVHRSGRTGRAGATGISVALIAYFERGKALRIASGAHFEPVWKEVPTPEAIRAARAQQLRAKLLAADAPTPSVEALRAAEGLLGEGEALVVIAALIDAVHAGRHAGYAVHPPETRGHVTQVGREKSFKRTPTRPAGRSERHVTQARPKGPEKGMDTLRIAIGERQHISPGALIQLVCKGTGLRGTDFGRIDIQPHATVFDVRTSAIKTMRSASVSFKGKELVIQKAK